MNTTILKRYLYLYTVYLIGIFLWYDFFIYTDLTYVFRDYFFNSKSSLSIFLYDISTTGSLFIALPIGAILWGYKSDKQGRIKTIFINSITVGTCGVLLGLIGSYDNMGIMASIFVCLIRFIQCIAIGGLWGALMTHIFELSQNSKHKSPLLNLIIATPIIGYALNLFTTLLIQQNEVFGFSIDFFSGFPIDNFTTLWGGWRILFYMSGALILLGFIIYKAPDSTAFKNAKQNSFLTKNPLLEIVKKNNYQNQLLVFFSIFIGIAIVLYLLQYYLPFALTRLCHINEDDATAIVLIASLMSIPFFPFFSHLSKKIGKEFTLFTGLILFIFMVFFVSQNLRNITRLERKYELLDLQETQIKNIINETTGDTIKKITTLNKYNNGSLRTTISYDTFFVDTKKAVAVDQRPKISIKVGITLFWQLVTLIFLPLLLLAFFTGPIIFILINKFPIKMRASSIGIQFYLAMVVVFLLVSKLPKYLVASHIIKNRNIHNIKLTILITLFVIAILATAKLLKLRGTNTVNNKTQE